VTANGSETFTYGGQTGLTAIDIPAGAETWAEFCWNGTSWSVEDATNVISGTFSGDLLVTGKLTPQGGIVGISSEYVYNTSSNTTTSDTSSFATGSGGALIGSITATLARRVRFARAITATDQLFLEVSSNQVIWRPLIGICIVGGGGVCPLIFQNTASYGATIYDIINTTDVDVRFGTYENTGSTFGAAGEAWRLAGSDQWWRVRKITGLA